jgi:hypothetical protein
MSTEAGVLTGLLGPELLPHLSNELNPGSEDELRAHMAKSDTPEWQRRAIEAQLVLRRIVEALRDETRA